MRVVVQRCSEAKVTIDDTAKGSITNGFVILVGIGAYDSDADIDYLIKKLITLRIFADDEGKMNLSIQDINGQMLIISQFTLHAKTKKGTRPSFINAAHPDIAIPLYDRFVDLVKRELGPENVATGKFGADMKVSLTNDGPVTIIIDSKNKE